MLFFGFASICQQTTDLNIDYMLRGHLYVQSSIEDKEALGGFGGSDNRPQKLTNKLSVKNQGLSLLIDTTRIVPIGSKYNGYTLYLVNKSDSLLKLSASDSRLNAVAEAWYEGKWQPIEYLPASSCGNSYHTVYLLQHEYWKFTIPKFAGKIPVKIRYRLFLGEGQYLYSNEITAYINKGQFKNKQAYQPEGIMDPYVD